MSEIWYNKFTIKKFNQILYNPHITKESAFYKLKTTFDFQEKCIIVDQLPSQFDNFIYGKALPFGNKELGTSGYFTESDSIEDEINWFFLSLRKYKDELETFINLKNVYNKNIILGDYCEAENGLNEIDKKVCFSLWSLENRLLLKELMGGIDDNKIFLGKIIGEKGLHFNNYIADFYSRKAENDLMINRYNIDFKNFVNKLQDPYKSETIEYYYFKANYFEFGEYKYDCTLNAVEFQNSIIDRYLSFIKIIHNQISNQKLEEQIFNKLKNRINYISKKISDHQIQRLYSYFHDNEPITLKEIDREAIKIFDAYSIGNYSYVERIIPRFLADHPESFELYIIYSKCIINQNLPFKPLNQKENFQNKILLDVYSILKKQNNPAIHLQSLRKTSYQLSSMSISNQIIDFISQESNNQKRFEPISFLSSQFVNPKFCKIYKDKEKAKTFLKTLDKQFESDSDTIKFWFHQIDGSFADVIDELNIPEIKKQLYLALDHLANKRFDDSIKLLLPLMNEFLEIPHTYETIIIALFNSYLRKNDIDNCINIFVDAYFRNQNFIIKLDSAEIIDKIRFNRFRGVKIDINLPIFFKLSNSLETRTTIACERFFASWNLKKPSELIENLKLSGNSKLSQVDERKYIFFFDKICTLDLFKHMVAIKGTKEKLNERLSITKYLLEIDPTNAKEHQEEIEEINRQILIQEGLQEYDESKIFINEKQIRNLLLTDVETEFHRFKNIAKIMKENPLLILIDSSTNQIQSISIKGKEKNKDQISYSTDPIFDLIKGMFYEIRDLFIDSDYGLREYLSARIRHGVFKSEIRPTFDKLKLLTEKDSGSSNYENNQYWNTKMEQFSNEVQIKVQKALSVFSANIDTLIEEEALKKHLHIRTESKNKDGWFNFEFDDNQLLFYSLKLRDCDTFQEFVDETFFLLWERTDENLEFIRNKFIGDVKDQYEKAIIDLELTLLNILPKHALPELFENITTSKVNIQNDMDRIARWFNLVGKQTKEFSINKIIEISTTNANKGYGKRKIKLNKSIECDFLFKGELYPSFVDIMYSFFKNTLEHCGLDEGEVETDLNIKLIGHSLHLDISNKIYGIINHSIEKFDAFTIETARSSDDRGSGLKKALRTITSDFGDENNTLQYYIDKETNTFNVHCIINIENLIYESTNN